MTVVLPALALVAVLAAIGGVVALALGLRGLWAAALAGPFAVSTVAMASVIAPMVGVSWSILPVAVMALVLAGLLLVSRRAFEARWPRAVAARTTPVRAAWALVALAGAAGIIGWRVLTAFGEPGTISQTFDNVFHLNAVRYILDTGSASSLTVGHMTGPAGFYPAVWHAIAALVVQLTGASIPVAVQAVVLVTSAVLWPAGAIALASSLLGARPAVMLATGAVAAAVPAFPMLMLDYGVLYPYQLSLALLPAVLAVTARLVVRPANPTLAESVWWLVALAGTMPALVLAHPGGFMGWVALSAPLFLVFLWRRFRAAATRRGRIIVIVVTIVYLGIGLVLDKELRPVLEARQWPTPLSLTAAVEQALTVSMFVGVPAILVAIAAIVGVVTLLVRRDAGDVALVAMWAVGALLFVAVSGFPHGALRDALTGSWYNDWPRLAALFTVALVPVAVAGLVATGTLVARAVRIDRLGGATRGIVLVAACAAVAVAAQYPAMPVETRHATRMYQAGPDAALLSTDERALLDRIDDIVADDAVIVGNPYTGTGLAYALADRRVLMPHMLVQSTPDAQLILAELDDPTDPVALCRALEREGVEYALDFGGREVHAGTHDYPGLDDLAGGNDAELVMEQGDARLYRITACDRG